MSATFWSAAVLRRSEIGVQSRGELGMRCRVLNKYDYVIANESVSEKSKGNDRWNVVLP